MKMKEKNDYKKFKLNTLSPVLTPPSKKINFPKFYFPFLIPLEKNMIIINYLTILFNHKIFFNIIKILFSHLNPQKVSIFLQRWGD